MLRIKFERRRNRGCLIGQIRPGIEERARDRPIEHAGVKVTKTIMFGQTLSQRALAGGCRPVNGDDHENSAPSARIIGMKSGKLVAIKAVSSTVTGLSEAKPITS